MTLNAISDKQQNMGGIASVFRLKYFYAQEENS
jgi:hypothetical protein